MFQDVTYDYTVNLSRKIEKNSLKSVNSSGGWVSGQISESICGSEEVCFKTRLEEQKSDKHAATGMCEMKWKYMTDSQRCIK